MRTRRSPKNQDRLYKAIGRELAHAARARHTDATCGHQDTTYCLACGRCPFCCRVPEFQNGLCIDCHRGVDLSRGEPALIAAASQHRVT